MNSMIKEHMTIQQTYRNPNVIVNNFDQQSPI